MLRERCAHTGPGLVVNSPVPGGNAGLNVPDSVRLSPKKIHVGVLC